MSWALFALGVFLAAVGVLPGVPSVVVVGAVLTAIAAFGGRVEMDP